MAPHRFLTGTAQGGHMVRRMIRGAAGRNGSGRDSMIRKRRRSSPHCRATAWRGRCTPGDHASATAPSARSAPRAARRGQGDQRSRGKLADWVPKAQAREATQRPPVTRSSAAAHRGAHHARRSQKLGQRPLAAAASTVRNGPVGYAPRDVGSVGPSASVIDGGRCDSDRA